ncbi:hypothetical protein EH243_10225 [Amphritea opalescens]|uniref:Antitermination protein NusG n=1 Tax=Amphritea opalescens TaxID=2490544 RepID=A0A430KQM2_9GAMM|nr:hypothetical protein [Amphritea opalescens]RTE65644.1 hypothetical protein EH243_10225 [Amphritea opalescens]
MVTKVLLTLLVLLIAYVYLKRRALLSQRVQWPSALDQSTTNSRSDRQQRDPIKMIAVLFLLVSFLLTLGFFVYHWVDGRQLLNVTLISSQSSEPLHYQVYKAELQERSFTTTRGQVIRLGAQDRLHIEPLKE